MKISGKASEVSWWMEPSGGPLSTQCTPWAEYWRPPSEFSKGEPLALAFGLALDVALGSPVENPLGTFNLLPREYIEYPRETP